MATEATEVKKPVRTRAVRDVVTPATKPAAKAKPVKAETKVVAPKANVAEAKPAKAPMTNVHKDAGLTIDYAGASSPLNGARKVDIMLDRQTDVSKITDRCQRTLYGLRQQYADKAFPARGIDNGVLRDLSAMKLIALHGGVRVNDVGGSRLRDGQTPVTVTITAAGMSYGKPAAK